jgi:hypothetical protein
MAPISDRVTWRVVPGTTRSGRCAGSESGGGREPSGSGLGSGGTRESSVAGSGGTSGQGAVSTGLSQPPASGSKRYRS